jgi:hypothetical protein
VKLTTNQHLVLKLKMVEIELQFSIRLPEWYLIIQAHGYIYLTTGHGCKVGRE